MRLASIKIIPLVCALIFSCSKSQPEEAVQDQDSESASETEGNHESATAANSLPSLPTATESFSSPSPQMLSQELQSAVLGLQDEANRVVRFVMNDRADIYEQANGQGKVVAQLSKGDPVVVVVHGEWAEISPHHFMKKSLLSNQVVPRKRLSTWNPFRNPVSATGTSKN